MSRQDRFSWLAAPQRAKGKNGQDYCNSEGHRRSGIVSPYDRHLRIEPLEDRRMLAVIAVDSLADNTINDGMITLREAILASNNDIVADPTEGFQAGSGADTIVFDASLDGGTILLAIGEFAITEAVTIDASALDAYITIDAQLNSRIFNIMATGGDMTLASLILTGGRTTGDNPRFSDSTYSGGAIRSVTDIHLTLTRSTVSGNSTAGRYARGGGIYAYGDVTITHSTVSGNSTEGIFARGGGIFANGAVTLTQSTVSGNITTGIFADGGGIFAYDDMSLTQSTVSGNSTEGILAEGGGLYTYGAMTLNQSTVSGNSTTGISADGGGIYSYGAVTLNQSTVSGNSTTGISADGGGIFANGAVTLTQSTVSDNHVAYANATGGGIFTFDDLIDNDPIVSSGSILAGNTAGGGSPDLDSGTSSLTVNHSLIGTGITPTSGGNNIVSNNPLLGTLADNGGPTKTHALLAGSAAIDAGDPLARPGMSGVPLYDQRGNNYGRVQNERIDIGAFEVRATLSADFNGDDFITGFDFLLWQRGFGITSPNATAGDGDADHDLDADGNDLTVWATQFGLPAPIEMRPQAHALAERVDLVLVDAWATVNARDGFDSPITQQSEWVDELANREKSGHFKRYAQTADDLFATLAEDHDLNNF
jgi:hypothetical protein